MPLRGWNILRIGLKVAFRLINGDGLPIGSVVVDDAAHDLDTGFIKML